MCRQEVTGCRVYGYIHIRVRYIHVYNYISHIKLKSTLILAYTPVGVFPKRNIYDYLHRVIRYMVCYFSLELYMYNI